MSTFAHFMKDEAGATALEYGLMVAAAGLAVTAIIPILRNT